MARETAKKSPTEGSHLSASGVNLLALGTDTGHTSHEREPSVPELVELNHPVVNGLRKFGRQGPVCHHALDSIEKRR